MHVAYAAAGKAVDVVLVALYPALIEKIRLATCRNRLDADIVGGLAVGTGYGQTYFLSCFAVEKSIVILTGLNRSSVDGLDYIAGLD